MDYIVLGTRIRAQRQKLNLTQEKFAERVGISESFLGHIERGNRKLSLETLVKISQELNVSIDFLLLGTIQSPPDALLTEIISALNKVDKRQTKKLLNIVKVLADNLEKWSD